MIAVLNKTTQISFLRILEPSVFLFHLAHLASPNGDARTHSDALAVAVKGQGADCRPFPYLPLNAVICRSLDTVGGLQSGSPDSRQLRSKSGQRDRRARWANPSQADSHPQDPQKTDSIRGRKS